MNDRLQAAQVTDFLRAQPDFLCAHPELLAALQLPHGSGAASLLEYQARLLREENARLRTQLTQLTHRAQGNDRLFAATRKLLLALLAADSLHSLLQAARQSLQQDFQMSAVSILLFADESATPLPAACRQVPLGKAREALGSLLQGAVTLCAALRDGERAFLFESAAEGIHCAALLPLRGERLYGLLAIGSAEQGHYQGAQDTLFLDYLAEVLPCLLQRWLVQSP